MSVVVGYVPDATGLLAIDQAAQEARWRGTDVVVVNVISAAGFARPTAADEQTLDGVAERLRADGVPFAVRSIDQSERVSDALLAVATETDAELIVVGMKRVSAVAKAVLGSTAQQVLAGATCPVLTVRATAG
jgi:nucleotide-binding universal stress UspA family protein